ncbi:MAG: rod shape-determining protein MreC [Bacteroidales bacterium]|nr:rod shape-determining protein MreC [Bacteroidales bacterium]
MIYYSLHYPHYVLGKIAKEIIYPVQQVQNEVIRHFHLETENADLLQQNLQLLREDKRNFVERGDTLKPVFETDAQHRQIRIYDYLAANVIYSTVDKKHNYLIIDRGSEDGITNDMAVFTATGVVGVTCDVSKQFATVMSVLHLDTRISAKILPTNYIGTVIWTGHDTEAQLTDIPRHVNIEVGDTVITSGYSNVYPKEIMIGTVSSTDYGRHGEGQTIKLALSTNFYHLNSVFIAKNLYKDELDTLKSRLKNE